jgi:diguanylate cyclase (GGDEF)-like protein/PAS domain S-box-containing protein
MTLARRRYRPFTRTGRAVLPAILALFVLITGLSIWFSTRTTDRSRNQAAVIEVIARQRTLAERYGKEVLLVRAGEKADPWLTGSVLTRSARALLDGGTAPSMNGDDDDTTVPAISDPAVRGQLVEEARLIKDLTTLGSRLLARPAPTPGSLAAVPQTAGENVRTGDPLLRLQALVALTSNVALNTARNVGAQADRNINQLALMQILLGLGWLLVSLLLAWGLIATIRRQTAHFRSLVTSSSDLVVVLEAGSCRYASRSLCRMVGRAEEDLLGDGLAAFVHPEDREALSSADRWDGKMIMIRVRNAAGEWRHLEARVTDLREDRHLRGIVLNARDVTERIKLERELMVQTQRDAFGTQLGEALEMADEEQDVYEVIERAMTKISDVLPMELLLSDSSRANLERAAANPTAGAPGCPVQSPYSCVAVRRGQPVEFESSEALNACPKLRDRAGGACSAACVPVSFMGRALGVVHATAAEGAPPNTEEIAHLVTLASEAGARIGTVRAFEKTQLQAATDSLTGLANRRTFEREVRMLLKAGRLVSVVVADLDYFKVINDTYGHEAGDRALRTFARVASEAVRDGDLVARWGGEEFVFALREITSDQAVEVMERLRLRLAAAHVGDHARFTASFGVTDSRQSRQLEQLILIADSGLYQSKNEGRDRITIGISPIDPSALRTQAEQGEMEPVPLVHEIRPLLHEAADEEDPRPSGAEIR